MKHALLVFLGGGLGSALRYGIGKYLNTNIAALPWGTLLANVLGSLLIGIIMGWALKNQGLSQTSLIFLVTGFCGGFTTFSAFAFENHLYLKAGDLSSFFLYTLGSLLLGITAVFAGIWLAKFF